MTYPTPEDVREAIAFLRTMADGLECGSVQMVGLARRIRPMFGAPGSFCLDYTPQPTEPEEPAEPRVRSVGERLDGVTKRTWP